MFTDAITLDFETYPIGPRPEHYPPKPVGLAWRDIYGDTGYETGWERMKEILLWALDCQNRGCPVLFHHAKFDCHVATKWFGVRFQDNWRNVHDTMFQSFLLDPYSTSGLKPLAVKWLNMPQDEKDAVAEWIVANKDRMPVIPWMMTPKGNPQRPTMRNAGAWIAWAPVELVGPYAIGDVERTFGLHRTFMPLLERCGLLDAYEVEREVLPMFMENEEVGLNLDFERLGGDIEKYHTAFDYAEEWLRWRLNAQGLNFDADKDVADILESRGIVTEWTLTAGGDRSVSKKNLHPDQFHDPEVAMVLGYRNRLKTCLKMFMEPWYEQASARPDRRISTDWNQIQGDGGGTKTGRPSTRNPNFLNISKKFEGVGDGYEHPEFLQLPRLPLVRKYIKANEGEVILKRDFSGQELHIFGHFEMGDLQRKYQENPKLDVHNYVGEEIVNITGDPAWVQEAQRTPLKAMNFQGLYGGGIPALSAALRIPYQKAKEFKMFHDQALPGRRILSDTLTRIVCSGRSIRTYGGRLYARPPFKKGKNGQIGPADYVLINYLVQGSAADITKRAMIGLKNHADFKSYWMLQVYDEMNISSPWEIAPEQMRVMQEVMESIPLSTSLPTDGEAGYDWGSMEKIKKPEDIYDALIPF